MTEILKGIRILEVSNFVSGPWACQMLAEFGAEVVKIEDPNGGDPFRKFSPDGYSDVYCAHNRHKKSVTIDLRNPRGAELFRRLAINADVVLENFRPGVMSRLGIGWESLREVNRRLIYCSITGFGSSGPYRQRPAYDTVIQAISGLLGQFLAPDNPRIAGPNVADSVTSLCAVSGVLGALYDRERTGRGNLVEISMIDSVIAFATGPIGRFFATGRTPSPYQRPSESQCFVFRCSDDRLISIHMSVPEKFWRGLLQAVQRPELLSDPRFETSERRIANYEELGRELKPSFAVRPRSEWERLLGQNDVPHAPVNNFEEVVDDPQVRHLGTFSELMHPVKGVTKSIGRPVSYDGSREFTTAPPPVLGEHTDYVLSGAGLSPQDITALRAAAVI